MSGPVVSQEVPGFDEQRLNPWKFLFEGVDIADTPCQPPDTGRLSATGLKTAVDVAREMQHKGYTVVSAEPRISRSILPYDFEAASVFLLRCVGADRLRGQAPASHTRNERNEYELDLFESPPTLHWFQL